MLESTYGARLHPNRQAEEQRLAQAVADGIARGGPVLIPSFALGRGQEILLILRKAQQKGEIPPFPIWVDGLVRQVCATYRLIPEALAPQLERQIRRGYDPFAGPTIMYVHDERDREHILAGAPACIIASSGMLTGGPSAWFAARLARLPQASILITGYQDEESPGRRLLDLAEQRSGILELEGQQTPVACYVGKFNLSAHADGGELVALADTLKPARVALVHGDQEARKALAARLTGTEVVLPANGETITVPRRRRAIALSQKPAHRALPAGIGQGAPLQTGCLDRLWRAVTQVSELSSVTSRQLALVWYGMATEAEESAVQAALAEEQPFFLAVPGLTGVYQVRAPEPDAFSRSARSTGRFGWLAGQVLLLRDSRKGVQPALCLKVEGDAFVRIQWPEGVRGASTRFPITSVHETVGDLMAEAADAETSLASLLTQLVRRARYLRGKLAPRIIAQRLVEGQTYRMEELCRLAGLDPAVLAERLALALMLLAHPRLFRQVTPVWEQGSGATYMLAPTWREAVNDPTEVERPDQTWILNVLERHLGNPPDLYRRSIDPDTGAVTLAFHFPDVARPHFAQAIARAAAELAVPITIWPHAHQGALVETAQRLLRPAGITLIGAPSLYAERRTISLSLAGYAAEDQLTDIARQFFLETGWQLEYKQIASQSGAGTSSDRSGGLDQHRAIALAQQMFAGDPAFKKVSADTATKTLTLRFHGVHPEEATGMQYHYAERCADLEQQTGWHVAIAMPPAHGTLHSQSIQAVPPHASASLAPGEVVLVQGQQGTPGLALVMLAPSKGSIGLIVDRWKTGQHPLTTVQLVPGIRREEWLKQETETTRKMLQSWRAQIEQEWVDLVKLWHEAHGRPVSYTDIWSQSATDEERLGWGLELLIRGTLLFVHADACWVPRPAETILPHQEGIAHHLEVIQAGAGAQVQVRDRLGTFTGRSAWQQVEVRWEDGETARVHTRLVQLLQGKRKDESSPACTGG